MTSKDFTREQLETLAEKTRQMTGYLHSLQKRLEQRRFPVDDELAIRVREAFDKVQHLHMTLAVSAKFVARACSKR
jgi:hypothetical protein